MLTLQREALQKAEHEHQEALFHIRTSDNKINEIESSIKVLSEQISVLSTGMDAEQKELAGCDEGPWQEQLQQALAGRTQREQVLAQARDALEGIEAQLKSIEQERLVCEQKLGPLRDRISELRLKEQEARLIEEQFAQQLADAGAREEELRRCSKKASAPARCRRRSRVSPRKSNPWARSISPRSRNWRPDSSARNISMRSRST